MVTILRRLWYWLQCALHLVARLVARLVAGLASLARDVCDAMWYAYPGEEAEEALRRALAEDEKEQEPWKRGYW